MKITVSPGNSRPEPQHSEELQTCRRSTTRRACRCCPLVGHKLAWLTVVTCAQDSLTQLDVQAFNDSQSVPLLPNELAWLMELVEQRLHNKSSLPLQLARAVTLARYTSVVYCNPENIRAWNCSR